MPGEQDEHAIDTARLEFRDALLRSHRAHGHFQELELAASNYCELLHNSGLAPERTVVLAKQVIEEAIDDHDRSVAERAVLNCIQQYYRRATPNSAKA